MSKDYSLGRVNIPRSKIQRIPLEIPIVQGEYIFGSNDPYVVALLHFDDLTSPTKDECGNKWTSYGSPSLTGTYAKSFYALQISGNQYIRTANPINLNGQDFTIDCWVCRYNATAYGSSTPVVWSLYESSTNRFQVDSTASNNINAKYITSVDKTVTTSNALNTSYHLAVSYKNGKFYFFQNGKLCGSQNVVIKGNFYILIGLNGSGGVSSTAATNMRFNGIIEEFRVSVGVARWTEDFTPPSVPDKQQIAKIDYDSNLIEVSGELEASEVGEHFITLKLRNPIRYEWSDGTVEDKTIRWKIDKHSLSCPTVNEKMYTGSELTVTTSTFNNKLIEIDTDSSVMSAVEVGKYPVVFKLKDPVNYQWEDGTTTDKTVYFVISRIKLAVPTVSTTSDRYIYNGSEQTPTFNTYDKNLIEISGELSGVQIATYTAICTLKDTEYYEWEDGTIENKNVEWNIIADDRVALYIPTHQANPTHTVTVNGKKVTRRLYTPYYKGTTFTAATTITGYNNQSVKLVNVIGSHAAPGVLETYKYLWSSDVNKSGVTYKLKDTMHYKWRDGTVTDKTFYFS